MKIQTKKRLVALLLCMALLMSALMPSAVAIEATENEETEISAVVSALNISPLGSAAGWTDTDMTAVVRGESSENASVLSVPVGASVYIRRGGYVNYGDGYVTDFYSVWMGDAALAHEGDVNYAMACFCACPSMTGPNTGHYSGSVIQKLTEGDVTGSTLNVFKAVILTSPFGSFAKYHQDFWNVYSLEPTDEVFAMVHAILGYLYDPGSAGTPYRWSAAMKNTILGTGGLLEQIINWANANADALNEVNVYRLKGTDSGLQDLVWMNAAETYPVYVKKVSANPTLTDGNSAYSLEGAEYTVYRDAACTNAVGTLSTGANGVTGTLNVIEGTYYAKETKAPKGYELNSNVLGPVTVSASNNPGVFNATDTPIPTTGSGKLVKQSSKPSVTDGNSYYSLAGAEYTVYSDDQLTKSVGVLKTDADGNSNTIELDAGTYYVKETKAPSGFEEDETVHTMVVKSGETSILRVQDVYIPGHVTLQKVSSNSEVTDGNENYSLAGAEYIVYSDKDCTTEVGTLTTKADGTTNTVTLPAGTYYAKESQAPSGFKLNTDVYSVTVKPGETGTFQATDEPIFGRAELMKESAKADVTTGNACYSLADAKYSVFTDETCKDQIGYFITDAEGKTEAIELPAGTYYVREQEAPAGYALDTKVYPVSVKCGETTVLHVSDIPVMNPIDLLLQKIDAETKQTAPQADASLAGAEYTIRFYAGQYKTVADAEAGGDPARTWVFRTDRDGKIQYQTKTYYVSGDKLYMGMDGKTPMLPLGTVVIQETKAPEGYLMDTNVYLRNITEDGKHAATVQTYTAPTSPEQVIKGNIQIVKHTDTGLTKIETPEEGAAFEVYLTSAGSYTKADDTVRDCLVIDKDGFAKSKDLPYGTYTVHQIKGWDGSAFIQDFQVKIDSDGKTYSYIINNERFYAFLKVVKLDSVTGETIPVEGIGFQIFTPSGELVSFWGVDTWYSNAEGVVKVPTDLEYGKGYTAVEQNAPEGYILATDPFVFNITPENAATEDDLLVVTLEAKNTPTQIQVLKVDPYGNPVSGAKLQIVGADGKVVDEWISDDTPHTIYKLPVGATFTLREVEAPDGYLLAESVTFTVQETTEVQTVTMENEKIPTIGTTATVNDLHVAQPKGEVDIVDTVHYTDVVPGRTYTVSGVLMDKETGDPITDADGKQITASRTFTPEASEGDVEVIFHVDAVLLEGKTTVCFEHLFKNGKQIAVHADLSDDDQTVYFPGIGTTATIDGEHKVVADGTLTLVDVVEYKCLEPGKEYTVKGVLMDKSTGEPFNDLTAEILFTPTEANGAVEVSFSFDSALLTEDTTLVAFETLYCGDMELAVHADLEDEGQTVTVHVPTMHTTATVGGEKTAVTSNKIVIDDLVTFTNLVVGKEYTLKGVLMNKVTGEKFLVNGEEVTSEVTFTPETSDGEVTVTFVFDGSDIMQETQLVVFETLYKDGVELLVHADIDDADQTVTIDTPDTPQTGDSITRRWFYIGGGALCLAAVCGLILSYRRCRKHD